MIMLHNQGANSTAMFLKIAKCVGEKYNNFSEA